MNRYYRIAIDKRRVGTAIEHREPSLRGEVITKVTDARTRGDFKIAALDATDEEHEKNLALPGVEALTEEEAGRQAVLYQPETVREERDPAARKVKKVKIPAVDLSKILGKHAARAKNAAK